LKTFESSIKEEKKQLFDLITKEAYFREKIILSSGKESDYYIDARLITLKPLGAYLCARQILNLVGNEKIDAIGGPTLGADPMIGAVGVVSLQQGYLINTFIIRKEAKAHGKGKQIEGPPLKKGSQVIVIDDVATTGKAFVHSLEVLQAMGVAVSKCICIVDREEGAQEAVEQKGSKLVSVFKAKEIHK
jgi:orotate phosphoribosyltransferase